MIVLYQPEIAGNVGTVLRLGACMGLSVGIIRPTGFVFSDKHLKRAAMDYAVSTVCTLYDTLDAFEMAQKQQRHIYVVPHEGTCVWDWHFRPNDCMIFGQESTGFPLAVYENKSCIHIPMKPGMRSMNVAMAVAMVTGEYIRQTQQTCPKNQCL